MRIMQAIHGKSYSYAAVKGDDEQKNIIGRVEFFPWAKGSIIKLEIMGLPRDKGENNFFRIPYT